ncbi:MAG TPA: thiamine ABC transporter substrate binding subunit [Dongiaceae bacterium]|nr:thiamine ABC transporter substrate binding subunit [Dongiaceae bacterium]
MQRTFALTLIAAASAALISSAASADAPKLTVYTYSSFVAEWGPGPKITPIFEQQCGCKIEWVSVGDGAALLSRLKLEGSKTPADVVLGLDTSLTSEATATGLMAPHSVDLQALKLPVAWSDPDFVPFDYGYFAFVYDSQTLKDPPKTLAELFASGSDPKMLLEDPRTSTPGLGLLMWLKAVYGDKAADQWKAAAPKILTVSKSWDEAYGLFTKGEAPIVLSYTTSPAYHIMEEKTDRYKALDFPEGNYMEVEVAGMLKTAPHPDLARKFLQFLVTADFQKQIPTTNWMFPVIDIAGDLPPVFRQIPQPHKSLLLPPDEVAAHRAAWIKEWLDAVGQ